MKFNSEIGIIHDTFFYFRMYYYEDAVMKYCYSSIGDPSEEMLYFGRIKSEVPVLPDSLTTFFYSDKKNYYLISNLFSNYVKWYKYDFNDFINLLKNKCFIKEQYIHNFFPDANAEQLRTLTGHGDPKNFYRLISGLNMPVEFNYKFKYTIELFDSLIDELIFWLEKVNTVVRKIHNENKLRLKQFTEQLSDKTIKKISRYMGIDEYIISTGTLGVTLFYPMLSVCGQDNIFTFLFGLKLEESIDFSQNYNHVSIYSASKIFADPTKSQMMELFFTQQSYTVPDIIRQLHLAKSTVVHHMDKLIQEKMIVLTGVKNRAFQYKVNHEYFDKLLQAVEHFKVKAQGDKD